MIIFFISRNTVQQNNTFTGIFFDIYLRIQYPNQCRGIHECQQSFRTRALSKFSDPQPFDISINLINGVIISLRLSLYRLIENYGEYKYANGDNFYKGIEAKMIRSFKILKNSYSRSFS
jgi:hypothetical protein